MKTRVYITTDVECAEERVVAGRPLPAQGYDLRVWGRFVNQSEDLGIGLIMRELEACGLKGTFYTEVFGAQYFGIDGLSEVCQALRRRGHDVQLHTHPIQRHANYRTRGEAPAGDNVADYDAGKQAELLSEGIEILGRCGIPSNEVVSFRAGNFGANNETWGAMARAGLRVSSNFNPCYFEKNCKMRSDASAPGLFDAGQGVWELPISNFREQGGNYRHVQITAVSLAEMKDYLLEARRLGIGEVTVVTHSFEFCHIDSIEEKLGRINTVNLLRLRGLCRFLRDHSSEFEVETVKNLAARLSSAPPLERGRTLEMPRGKRRHRARRLIEQALKRAEARVPLSFARLARA